MIIRQQYLSQIRAFYEEDLIKVLVGIRRCGKSTVLKQIKDELLTSGINENNIISMNFEDYGFYKYKDKDLFYNYLLDKMQNDDKYYFLLDEIQEVEGWELIVNSFKATKNVSIFITGSNSKLLSGELATHLAGRYISFNIYPFNFKEYLLYKDSSDHKAIFNDYMNFGSMPQSLTLTDVDNKLNYLRDLYDSIILKDIVERYKIKDVGLFKTLLEYFMTNPSQMFSVKSLENYFKSVNRKVSNETIYNYLEYMQNTFLISKAVSYDVRGKRILTRMSKYYLADLGFVGLVSQGKKKQLGAVLENIVYNELKFKGYNVYVGNIKDGEIDFVCEKYNTKFYVQVAYLLSDDKTIQREFSVYDKITDNYKKYVVSLDEFDMSQNGIIHKNVMDFILELE